MNLICKHAAPIYSEPCGKCRTEYNDARDMVNERLRAIQIFGERSLEDVMDRANKAIDGMILPGGYRAQVHLEEGKLGVRYFR